MISEICHDLSAVLWICYCILKQPKIPGVKTTSFSNCLGFYNLNLIASKVIVFVFLSAKEVMFYAHVLAFGGWLCAKEVIFYAFCK